MVTSSTVYGYARSCASLIRQADTCKRQMESAIRGREAIWKGMGGEEFEENCRDWIRDMERFRSTVSAIETSLNQHANELRQAEERQRREEEERRREEERMRRQARESRTAYPYR